MPASRDAEAERGTPSGAKPNPPRPKKQQSATQIAATAKMGQKQKAASSAKATARDPPSGAKPNPPRPKKQRSAMQIAATAKMGQKQKAASSAKATAVIPTPKATASKPKPPSRLFQRSASNSDSDLDCEPTHPPTKKQKTKEKVVEVVDLISAQHQPNHNKTTNQLKRKRNGLTTKKTTNKKVVVSENRPRNDEERKALQMKKTKQTMFAYVNFPAGRKTKSTKKVEANNSPIPNKATPQKSACKVSMSAPRATYKNYDDKDPARKAAMELGMKTFSPTNHFTSSLLVVKFVRLRCWLGQKSESEKCCNSVRKWS